MLYRSNTRIPVEAERRNEVPPFILVCLIVSTRGSGKFWRSQPTLHWTGLYSSAVICSPVGERSDLWKPKVIAIFTKTGHQLLS
jgi:hypothetical protein